AYTAQIYLKLCVTDRAVSGFNGADLIARLIAGCKNVLDRPAVLGRDYQDHSDPHIERAKHLEFVDFPLGPEVIKHRENRPGAFANRCRGSGRKYTRKVF